MTNITTDVDAAVAAIKGGELVGLPTETVYGLAADATRVEAVRAVFAAKRRPVDHPLIVHVAGAAQIDAWAIDVPDVARRVAAAHWPGPLTILLRRGPAVLDEVTGGRDTVALRAPAHPMAHAVLDRLVPDGIALVAPSANRFGRVSPTSAADVVDELGTSVGVVLDGGECSVGVESTIVDLSGATPRLLRHGRVSLADLAGDIPDLEVADAAAPAVAPGMLASHYAPAAQVVVLEHDAGADAIRAALHDAGVTRRAGVLALRGRFGEVPHGVVHLDAGTDVDEYARLLYRLLRDADARGLDVVVAVAPPPDGIGAAVADRLVRAAHPRPG